MSVYNEELAAVRQQGLAAHDAMEAWVSAPPDAPEVPGAVLEGHAKQLRDSRERIRALIAEHGERDDLKEALLENETFHASLGLSIRDKPEIDPDAP